MGNRKAYTMDMSVDKESPIIFREFVAKYKDKLPKLISSSANSVPFYFASESPVSKDIEISCSLDQLSSPPDLQNTKFEPSNQVNRSNATTLSQDKPIPKTYTALKIHKTKFQKNSFSRIQQSYKLVTLPTLKESEDNEEPESDDYELLISIRFYRPPRAASRSYKMESPVFAEELICLGSNLLTELRDKISCVCNGKRFVDVSNDPDAALPTLDTNPGYFFIHNTFFNDNRNPNNCDYSKTVLNWANMALGEKASSFETKSMGDTRFIDLTAKLGSPMQYLHHGNCEHLFVFAQLEVVQPGGLKVNRNLYPYLNSFNNYNRRACYLCGLRSYTFIVEQSTRQLYDPSYLCRPCFSSFHYIDGKKIGEFKAYRIYNTIGDAETEGINSDNDEISSDNEEINGNHAGGNNEGENGDIDLNIHGLDITRIVEKNV